MHPTSDCVCMSESQNRLTVGTIRWHYTQDVSPCTGISLCVRCCNYNSNCNEMCITHNHYYARQQLPFCCCCSIVVEFLNSFDCYLPREDPLVLRSDCACAAIFSSEALRCPDHFTRLPAPLLLLLLFLVSVPVPVPVPVPVLSFHCCCCRLFTFDADGVTLPRF